MAIRKRLNIRPAVDELRLKGDLAAVNVLLNKTFDAERKFSEVTQMRHNVTMDFIAFIDNSPRFYHLCNAIADACVIEDDEFHGGRCVEYVHCLIASIIASAFSFGKEWREHLAMDERAVVAYSMLIDTLQIAEHLCTQWRERNVQRH